MQYLFVGTHPESLASGRPLVFGDEVDASELDATADARLADLLVDAAPAAPAPPAQPEAPKPEPTTPEAS